MRLPEDHNWRRGPIISHQIYEIVCADCDEAMWIAGRGIAELVMALDPYLDEQTREKL